MAKRLRTAIVALVLIVVVLVVITAVYNFLNYDVPDRESPDAPAYFDPTFGEGDPRLDLEVPAADASDAEKIAFVVELYNIACENYKLAEKAAFQVQYMTNMQIGGGNMPIPGTRYSVKDGDKKYYLDFCVPSQEIIDAVVGLAAEPATSHYAEAQYTDSTMDYVVSRKVYEDCGGEGVGAGPLYLEDGSISVDWTPAVETQLPKTVYAAYQEGDFRHTDHDVSVDTIIPGSVTIEYNEEFGYYICDFKLDPNKVPEALLAKLRADSGFANARYTDLQESMTIWNSGYFRNYHAIDTWDAGSSFIASVLDFDTTYYFNTVDDADKFDIANYQYMAEMCHK